jgi:hypothetical protein
MMSVSRGFAVISADDTRPGTDPQPPPKPLGFFMHCASAATDNDYGPIGINAGHSYARGDYFLNDSVLSKAPNLAFQAYTDTGCGAARCRVKPVS